MGKSYGRAREMEWGTAGTRDGVGESWESQGERELGESQSQSNADIRRYTEWFCFQIGHGEFDSCSGKRVRFGP